VSLGSSVSSWKSGFELAGLTGSSAHWVSKIPLPQGSWMRSTAVGKVSGKPMHRPDDWFLIW
jgi:hypothetical protein